GVVLEQVDLPADALLVQTDLGRGEERLEDPLPRLVVSHQVRDLVAFGRRVLGVRADVQVKPGAVLEEDVRGASPVHDPSEQVPGHLVGREPPLSAERAGDAVLVLEPEDASFHASSVGPARTKAWNRRLSRPGSWRPRPRSGGGTSGVAGVFGRAPRPRPARPRSRAPPRSRGP